MPGPRGLRLINDTRQVKAYVGRHRAREIKRGLRAMALGAFLIALVTLLLEFPQTTALVVITFVAMAIPGVYTP